LASIQHVYRRGHVFWWRRVLCIADESSCDIRLSLKTADRRRARELGHAYGGEWGLDAVGRRASEEARGRAPSARPSSCPANIAFTENIRKDANIFWA
jgi:hypothetical protein